MAFRFYDHDIIPGVKLINIKQINDERGWFKETYVENDFFNNELNIKIVQENHSCSKKNVFRGMHYQSWPYEQGKLIRVINGSLVDFFVDLRVDSNTFGKLGYSKLDKDSHMIWIPRGFAHGVYTLEDDTELIYKCDNKYFPLSEHGIYVGSIPEINSVIDEYGITYELGWVNMSDKDLKWPDFCDAKYFE
jgi:dTDP-4-dehydrorhamnose 3,5-epimerase